MSRQSRMFYIMHYLSAHQEATAPFLAAKLEVSVRTIYRDIDHLSVLGFPIYAQNGRNGGLRLLENHQLPATFVTEAEQETILSGLENLSVTNFGAADEVMVKLSSLFNRKTTPWLSIDYSSWGKPEEKQLVDQLTAAKKQQRCVIITYENTRGEVSKREVAPNKLFFKQHSWYLSAYCYLKNDHRIFKLKRVKRIEPSDKMIDPAVLTDEYLPVYELGLLEFFIENEQLARLQEELSNLTIERSGERLKVSTYQSLGDWLFSYLLSYGASIEVIQPKELREQLKEEIEKYQTLYF
ncbi:helix-turn-helix transcriptional regulator [Enterococcus sp. LJL128]